MSVSNPLHSKHLDALEAAHKAKKLWDVSLCITTHFAAAEARQNHMGMDLEIQAVKSFYKKNPHLIIRQIEECGIVL